jgi:MFS family permease
VSPRISALAFVVGFGVVSMLADFVYEGARSAIGPYLATLGASGFAVGVIAGTGEAVALVFRLLAGPLADRTGRFWAFTIAGYLLTVVSVPLLALSGNLGVAVALVMAERLGKAVRTPARDTMLAAASTDIGRGWGFALHEALDQSGAVVGPLVVAIAIARSGSYRWGFAVLAIPAALAIAALLRLRVRVPDPLAFRRGEQPGGEEVGEVARRFGSRYWRYLTFTSLTVVGVAPFALISYHAKVSGLLPDAQIPLLYAAAMAVDAVAALGLGRLYDRIGLRALVVAPLLTAVIPLLSFSTSAGLLWLGVGLWGTVMGLHESTLRAAVADLVPAARTATAYGAFAAIYGLASLAGDAGIGFFYETSRTALAALVVAAEVAALAAFFGLRSGSGAGAA